MVTTSVIVPSASVSQSQPHRTLFPLPLTAMETLMVLDSTPSYPMMTDMELSFQGRIERPAFEAALSFAMARHPLYHALVERSGRRGFQWVATDRMPTVDWAPLGAPLGPRYGEFVDLSRDIGQRIWVRVGAERSTVLLHLHHACSDALGEFGFIEDLLAGYANACGAVIQPRVLEPHRLASRGEFGRQQRGAIGRVAFALAGAAELVRTLSALPRPLASLDGAIADDAQHARPAFIAQMLPEEVTAGLRCAAIQAGTTVNDVLVRDLFLTLRDWQRLHDPDRVGQRMRILVPQNLRERDDELLPAANVMGFSFLNRTADQCTHPDWLLRSIQLETATIRRRKQSRHFLTAVKVLDSLGLLSWLLQRKLCFATAVLTNPGDSTRRFTTTFPHVADGLIVGNLVYEGVDALPPLRPLTRAAFGIRNSARSLTVSLKADPTALPATARAQLLADFVSQLGRTAEFATQQRQREGQPSPV